MSAFLFNVNLIMRAGGVVERRARRQAFDGYVGGDVP